MSHWVLRGISKSSRDKRIPITNGWILGRFVTTRFLHWSCWQWVSPWLRGEQQRPPAPPPLRAPDGQEKEKSSLLLPPSCSFIEHCWMCSVLSLSLLHRQEITSGNPVLCTLHCPQLLMPLSCGTPGCMSHHVPSIGSLLGSQRMGHGTHRAAQPAPCHLQPLQLLNISGTGTRTTVTSWHQVQG